MSTYCVRDGVLMQSRIEDVVVDRASGAVLGVTRSEVPVTITFPADPAGGRPGRSPRPAGTTPRAARGSVTPRVAP